MIKHGFNDHFEWQNREGPFRLIDENQARQYNEQGFLVFEGVFDSATIDSLTEELDVVERKFEDVVRDHFGGRMFIARALRHVRYRLKRDTGVLERGLGSVGGWSSSVPLQLNCGGSGDRIEGDLLIGLKRNDYIQARL